MPQNTAKCIQIGRGPYTPPAKRLRVIERHLGGESNRSIATEERLDRATVARVLSGAEVAQMLAGLQAQLLSLGPIAITVLATALSSPNERVRVAVAKEVLEGVGVLHRGGIEQSVNIANQASLPQAKEERVQRIIGEIAAMSIKKCSDYDIPFPEQLAHLQIEAEPAAKLLQA